ENHGGFFDVLRKLEVGSDVSDVAFMDLNGDARPDLVLGHRAGPSIEVRFGLAPLELGTGQFYPLKENLPLGSILPGDLNGDGSLDLAVGFYALVTLLNRGDGRLDDPVRVLSGSEIIQALVDIDGDGDLDVAGTNGSYLGRALELLGGDVIIARNRGDGSFEAPEAVHVGGSTLGLAAADFDGDHDIDLAVEELFGIDRSGEAALVIL